MCVLRVTGLKFDPKAYLRTSSMRPCSGFLAGTPRFKSKPDGAKNATSGFNVSVSDAEWSDLAAQAADACAFIATHEAELRALRAMPEVDDIRLDFPVAQREVFVQCEYFPPDLVSAAGRVGLGIEISIYPCADDDEEEEREKPPLA